MIFSLRANAQNDTVVVEKKEPRIRASQHQLRLGLNVSSPVVSQFVKNRTMYEATLDYCLKNDAYIVLEGGFGSSDIDYADLKYASSNYFVRVGIDKSMLQRLFVNDWDMVFVGLRYGISSIKRKEATFTTNDNFWGVSTGVIPAKNLTAHWAELTAGMRVELLKHFFAGYTIRARFLMNQRTFSELPRHS